MKTKEVVFILWRKQSLQTDKLVILRYGIESWQLKK